MKLERNRAERRSKKGAQILYKGIPFLIFAALAAGFLFGAPQAAAVSSIAQADRCVVTVVKRRFFFPGALAGYIGKTNSVVSSKFTESDFTYTGSYNFVPGEKKDFKLDFLSSGTFTPKKKVTIDIFLLGGGSGGRASDAGTGRGGAGGSGGRTKTHLSITINANQSYPITIGAGGTSNNSGGATSFDTTYIANGGTVGPNYQTGGTGGSGGGGAQGGNGGSNGSDGTNGDYTKGSGQGTTTRAFGETSGTLYAGGGGGGGGQYSYSSLPGTGGAGGGANGGARQGGNGGSCAANTGGGAGGGGGKSGTSYPGGAGGSGRCTVRNAR